MCISTIVCYFLCDSERPESILRERIGPGKKISDINTYLFWQKCSNSYWNDFSSKLKHIFQLGLGQNKKLLLSMFLFQIGIMYTFDERFRESYSLITVNFSWTQAFRSGMGLKTPFMWSLSEWQRLWMRYPNLCSITPEQNSQTIQ